MKREPSMAQHPHHNTCFVLRAIFENRIFIDLQCMPITLQTNLLSNHQCIGGICWHDLLYSMCEAGLCEGGLQGGYVW